MPHPIIALWSHPRSMSTAVERIMRERGDLVCLHEPFLYDYYVARKVRELPHFEAEPGRPVDYEGTRDWILEMAEHSPVFFKDMSYYVVPRILEDVAFSQRLTNCFLIRNPLASISSYYKLDPGVTQEEIGLAAQRTHYDALSQSSGSRPPVIQAEAVQADTKGTMAALWQHLDLPYREEAFLWKAEEAPKDWEQVGGWHGNVAASGGIRKADGDPAARAASRFQALLAEAPHLADYLASHQAAYEALRAGAIGAN